MSLRIVWRLPTLKEIAITSIIVIPIALILVNPMKRARLNKYPGAIEVKRQLKKSSDEIIKATEGILKYPGMIPLVSDEIKIALKNDDSKIRLILINALRRAVPDQNAYRENALYVTNLMEIYANIAKNDPSQEVRRAAILSLYAWGSDNFDESTILENIEKIEAVLLKKDNS